RSTDSDHMGYGQQLNQIKGEMHLMKSDIQQVSIEYAQTCINLAELKVEMHNI
ncbi:hypothetical protein J1N35_010832, partial [Gossypium stocksii]